MDAEVPAGLRAARDEPVSLARLPRQRAVVLSNPVQPPLGCRRFAILLLLSVLGHDILGTYRFKPARRVLIPKEGIEIPWPAGQSVLKLRERINWT
jgi:hypothetical protein